MLPPGITTATVTFGKVASVVGSGANVALTVTPSHDLVWSATGDAIAGFSESADVDAGIIGQIELPHTDQPGFITRAGKTITDWHYVAVAIASLGGQRRQWRWVFSLLTGQDTVDLDLLPTDGTVVAPGLGTLPEVLSVNGQTGAVTVTADVDPSVVAQAVSDHLTEHPVDGLPEGGTEGQLLGRVAGGEAGWVDPPAGGGDPVTWDDLDKPDVIAAGPTQEQAREAIGAGTSSLELGTTSDTAKPGDWEPNLSGYVQDGDSRLSNARPPTEHSHPVGQIDAAGTASGETFLRGDGEWAVPPSGAWQPPVFADQAAALAALAADEVAVGDIVGIEA